MTFSGPYPERPYVLCSGSSEGLGREFALQISKRGTHHLILVARTTSKLEKVAAECKQIFKKAHPDEGELDVVLITEDLSALGAAEKVFEASKHLPVSLLINNAGIAQGGPFDAHTLESVKKLLYLNVNSLTEMTSLFLPYLKKAARHYSSKTPEGYSLTGLMNVSSLVGEMAMPYMSEYAASKAFVTSFTEGLHHELLVEGSKLPVVASLPGNTTTEIWGKNGADASRVKIPFTTSSHVVASSLSALDSNSALVIPGIINNIMHFSLRLAPRFLIRYIGVFMMSQNKSIENPYQVQGTEWKLSV